MIFPLQVIRVLRVTGNHSKISSFTFVWMCISSCLVMVIFVSLILPFPLLLAPLTISVCFISVWGSEEVDFRIKRIFRERGREEWEQGSQARTYRKALLYSSPNIPTVEHALSFPVPRILFTLSSQPQVVPFFPLNLLIPPFPSAGHCASNAKHRPRQ